MPINFPDSPSLNDTHTVNGRTWAWNGTYWKLSGSANRGISLQISDTAPSDPVSGDMWYESDTGRTFTYYDGFWVELGNSAAVESFISDNDNDTLIEVEASADNDTITFTTGATPRFTIGPDGHIVPGANETYDLGSASNRFRDLYLSGNSINLGGATISSDGTNIALPPISNIAGDLTVDTSTLYVDSTNNRLGIGTTSPNSHLDVHGQVIAHGSTGTNTTTQVGAITVNNNSADNTVDFTQGVVFTDNVNGSGPWTHAGIVAVGSSGFNGSLVFGTDGDSTNSITGITERMRIDSSGNVGIGTTTPSYTLDVSGTGRFTDNLTTSGILYYGNSAIVASDGGSSNIDHIWHDDTGNAWNFCSDTTYRARGNSSIVTAHHYPNATNAYDLGSSTYRWRNIYTQDLHLSNGIGDYTVVEGEEDLYLTNNKTGKSFKFALIEVDPTEVPKKSEVQ